MFNKRFYRTKKLLGWSFVTLIVLFFIDLCFDGIPYHFVIRALLWAVLGFLAVLLILWRNYLARVAMELSKEQ